MADWLLEEGIGEHRAILPRGDRIVAAQIDWPGELAAGSVIEARLVSRRAGSPRGTAMADSGDELLVDRLPGEISEGARLRLEVTRAALGERGRLKRAQARPSERKPSRPALAERLAAAGHEVRAVRRFPVPGWDELVGEALGREVGFAGGTLLFATTPAMTTVDIDGELAPRALALAAIPALALALRRFDLGGSIAIDFPTLADKEDRRAVDAALGEALREWPHERTAINGFGLVQLVARSTGPSLLHRAVHRRPALLARQLLRSAETVAEPGALLLTAHPAVAAAIGDERRAELARRTGREVRLATDPALALEGGFAQAVPR